MMLVRRLRPILMIVALAMATPLPAFAQQRIQIGDLVQRLERLESEVTRLRVSPRNGGGDVARLDQIESELRRLTGIVEQLDYQNRKLSDATDKKLDRFEERLDALEDAPPPAIASIPRAAEPNPPMIARDAIGAPEYAPQASLTQPIGTTPDVQTSTSFASTNSGQSAEAIYNDGLRLLNRGQFDEAGAQFEELIAVHPQDARAGQAQYWLGDMHFKLGRFEQAATAFLESFRNWPDGTKAPDSLLKLGMTLAIIGKQEEACLSLSQVPMRYPSASPTLLRRAGIEGQRAGCGG